MTQYKESAIPVLDGEGRVINDLRVSEILAAALRGAEVPIT